ncbi:MAG: hypothetical protein E4H27_03745 [Anaerolineales bacterium]|nr:MAG: hypothetical protein E4H27_03745 [Anaerolineales bacterium]
MLARRTIEKVWNWLGEDRRAVEILTMLLLVQLTTLLLPQSPVPATQTAAFTQWVAQLLPALGILLRPLTFLGLLNIRSSVLFRVILALVGLLAAVRIDTLWESWRRMQTTARNALLLFCAGSILVLSGWMMQILFGWAEPELVTWPGAPITIAEYNLSLAPKPPGSLLWTEKYGIYLIRTGWAVGLDITAADEEGQPLAMLRSSKDALHQELQVILTGTPPEAFFLIPETELVYRLHQLEDKFNAPVNAQVYRSASGELLAEVTLKDGENLVVETTNIAVIRAQLPRYRILYNPGAPLEGLGVILLLACVFLQAGQAGHRKPDGGDSE